MLILTCLGSTVTCSVPIHGTGNLAYSLCLSSSPTQLFGRTGEAGLLGFLSQLFHLSMGASLKQTPGKAAAGEAILLRAGG